MYVKDKNHRITLRLNDDQFDYVIESAKILDVSPSELLRMVINSTMVMQKRTAEEIKAKAEAKDHEQEQTKQKEA